MIQARSFALRLLFPCSLLLACRDVGGSSEDTDDKADETGTSGGTAPTSGSVDGDAGECPTGRASCPCTAGGACDPGLMCMSDMCVEPSSDTDDGTTTSTTNDGATEGSTSSDSGSTEDSSTTDGGTTEGTTSNGSSEDGSTGDTCPGGVLDTLPIQEDGWVDGECNAFQIQGPWYCYDDGVTPTSCVEGQPPYDGGAMCLTGDALGPVPETWGAGIGLGLAETEDRPPTKSPYNAAARSIIGFQVTITGFTGGNELRVGFTSSAAPTLPAPFVAVQGAGTHDILLVDAIVPPGWAVPNAGETVDPTAIYDVQVQLAGDGMIAPFDFCIASLTPITNP